MVLRKTKIKVDGMEIEVEEFGTALALGSGKQEGQIRKLLHEEEIEKDVQEALKRIDECSMKYGDERNIWYFYELGKILQFVDTKGYGEDRLKIWARLGKDLRPGVFYGKDESPKKPEKYPEIMYLLSKQDKELIKKYPRVTWSHWFEILQYPKVYKNLDVLNALLNECEEKKLSSEQARKRVQIINRSL